MKKVKVFVWGGFMLIMALLIGWLYSWSVGLIIVILTCFVGFASLLIRVKKENFTSFIHFFDKSKLTTKFYTHWIILSVTLLSIIFGINSNILSQYEYADQKEFNWWSPSDAVRFPVEQLRYNLGSKDELLDFTTDTEPEKLRFLFMIDRTKSNLMAPSCKECDLDDQKRRLILKILGEEGTTVDEDTLNTLDYQSLMTLVMIKYISDKILEKKKEVTVGIAYHDGIERLQWLGASYITNGKIVRTLVDENPSKGTETSIRQIIGLMTNNTRVGQRSDKTYFDLIFSDMLKKVDPNCRNIITVLSDFGHDTGPNGQHQFKDIESVFSSIPQKDSIQMNLVKFPFTVGSDDYLPELVTQIIKQKLSNTYVYDFDINKFYIDYASYVSRMDKIEEFVTPTVAATKRDLFFIHPVGLRKNNETEAGARIRFKGIDETEVLITPIIASPNDLIQYSESPFTDRTMLLPNVSKSLFLKSDEYLKLIIPDRETFSNRSQIDVYCKSLGKKSVWRKT